MAFCQKIGVVRLQFIHVSAKQGLGIDELLDAILLQAEVLELKAVKRRYGKRCCYRILPR